MNTISAISTPKGKGGVAMIRISGENALQVAEQVFKTASGKKLYELTTNTAVYGSFFDNGEMFDDGIVTIYRSPRSFTGEDVAELCCHGGILATQKLLTATFTAGASPASAGEFTRRAFINGKITLTQAEAIGGLIDAKSEKQLAVSILQSNGALSNKLKIISDKLTLIAASVYAYIDYPEEDLTDLTIEEMQIQLTEIYSDLKKLTGSYKYGKAISEGVKTAIIGKPNTGKSSLLNCLIGFDRAIVTDIAGTTRDIITEQVNLGGVILNLSDTAGLRSSSDIIENMGIQKSREELQNAQLIFAVFDCSQPLTKEDYELIELIKNNDKTSCTIAILNKSDIGKNAIDKKQLTFKNVLTFSAKKSKGIEQLIQTTKKLCGSEEIEQTGEIIMIARQYSAIKKAENSVADALTALKNFTQDIVGLDIENAISQLNEADGRAASELVVNEIFSKFCVGK